ncbi:hypothetical protein Leryth_000686 [Lithospermum erythrorhizon]|nr:hypothetical protein Leryth_000686 [Lithospermum erythrorhizon]
MDKEQEEIQYLGFFGILKESCNIMLSCKKIFLQISLALMVPLSFIYLSQILISDYLFSDIIQESFILDHTPTGTTSYNNVSNILSSDWTKLVVFKLAYFIFFVVLSLLSTSAVVYTIACIYTAKEFSFKKVMDVVPKVWKRLMVTFVCNSIVVFAYNMMGAIVLVTLFFMGFVNDREIGAVFVIFLIIYFVGLVYISLIWYLANVVSVLEDVKGTEAMLKSQRLLKGKMGISVGFIVLFGLCFIGNQQIFDWFVVAREQKNITSSRIGFGILCLLVHSGLMLLGLIVHTIIYFVCKSYHHESIDKSSLSNHLEVYLGEYVPLKSKDVQLGEFDI